MAEGPRAEKSFELRDFSKRAWQFFYQRSISFFEGGLCCLGLSEALQTHRPAIKDMGPCFIRQDLRFGVKPEWQLVKS